MEAEEAKTSEVIEDAQVVPYQNGVSKISLPIRKPNEQNREGWVQLRVKAIEWTEWKYGWKYPVPKTRAIKDITVLKNGNKIQYYDKDGNLVKRTLGVKSLRIIPYDIDISEIF